ncbi:ent-copalyl diphosphate synthase, chloroplastic [Arachis hypogaea]|uniref:ent-copalyl diphosphate synthase, chloroplastic n=1 Tax=Arachis hypogaea TaxID=3818 RepID=UPI000DEC4429|nr:ent-copalyl diphosphate synthase, chloroplastic isoform X1 [Arachis hypogaea]
MSSHHYFFSTYFHPSSLFSSSYRTLLPFSHLIFSKTSACVAFSEANNKGKKQEALRYRAVSKPRETLEGGITTLKVNEINVDETIQEEQNTEVEVKDEIKKRVKAIKSLLDSMEDGEISVSAYDTAWVALVEDVKGSGSPQFPKSLEWISNNQLLDGSWGDSQVFSAHDRILNTLACVVALKTWNMHPEQCDKGMKFFKENLEKLQNENDEHMPIGFEVAFPSLMDIARKLNIEVPEDSPILKEIYAKRNLKLTRIPREVMHKVPTTLLHSLEGMSGLNWKQLLKLQSQDGSFLFSPSSTAFALMQTKDHNCFSYLNKAINKFNGGVPNVYPVDLFEHLWTVDRLQRLGISRYFGQHIKNCLSYVFNYWTEKGICWAKNSSVQDIDDTAMGFRLLRLHGYKMPANVFENFQRNGEFFCFAGQSTQGLTGMFNLYRATQLMFPGEEILESAKSFSKKFLREKRESNQLVDKWIIMKNLPEEVAYALDIPWYASLNRVETRFYIDQYGGENDIWIGKTLYRMPIVNNNHYLDLAKLDYNNCQAVHLTEWKKIQEWYSNLKLAEFGLSKNSLLLAYFLAAASIYEPERSQERLAWAKTTALLETIASYVTDDDADSRKDFVTKFTQCFDKCDNSVGWRLKKNKTGQELAQTLVADIDQISWDILVSHGHEIGYDMHHAWKKWLSSWQLEGNNCEGKAGLLVHIINLSGGHWNSEEELSFNPQYQHLLQLTNSVCHKLYSFQKDKENEPGRYNGKHKITTSEVESEMRELVQLVLQKSSTNDLGFNIKNTFLMVAKSFYYAAFCDSRTINFHVAKVLFEKVV